ncbi:CRISPR-associated helicase Cas3' [uncultured Varibaculum sp.]|uniref:CRISPR-associated helicase Cas3' n=1 Tax=uncultured Varibaculum sp. TaxID=413896 RepID=UPI002593C6F2|nr:CRISPR-associated helicase Cas3' [uncultured Varibaculum sp.]
MRLTKRVASDFPLSKAALSIWAKTNFWHSAPPEDVNKQWLPLAVHMADSGEVAELIWDNYLSQRQRQILADPLLRVKTIEEPSQNTLTLVKLIVGAHDIGKCSPMFLTQNTELYERVLKHSLTRCERAEEMRGSSPHSWIGEIAFEKWLESRWNPGKAEKRYVSATAKQLGSIIGAHHGRPVSWRHHDDMANPNLPLAVNGDKTWKQTRRELLDWWMNWTDSQEIIRQCKGLVFPTTWQSLVAGITVMADWIASNQELFPLVDWNELYPERLLAPERHRQRTKAAWEKLHLPPSWQPEILSQDPDQLLQTLFALGADAHARPAQVAAVEAAKKMTLPGMMIIEEVMGAGKTEAALMAATILAKRAETSGVLVALPTKATTDAMFARVVEWAQASAKTGFSLKLQHGNATLNSLYKKIQYGRIASAGNAVSPGQSSSMGIDEESGHSRQPAVVHRWFKKKAALLASVVVCTVDHLLFSALQTKHVSLRHLGISDKVVIIDEVHSYDVYTSQFLKRTVQWLGAFGVPVIALSATLTRRAREELFAAYKKGQELKRAVKQKDKGSNPFDGSIFAAMHKPQLAGGGTVSAPAPVPVPESDAHSASQTPIYPALSYSDAQGVKVRPLPVLATKKIEVEHWEGDARLLADLEGRLKNGGCVLVVRNTVANAQRSYETLRAVFGDDVRLVHSRFTQQDRQDNDEWLVRTFGKPGKSRRPKRAIVVGTQVVEQSLDIDFDVLYSDLAPIDLLFQRMGRVHRHERESRPPAVRQPRCILMGVPSKGKSNPQVDSGSTYVYDEDVLLRTAAYVLDKEVAGDAWEIPTDIGTAVAAVYEETVATPDSWGKTLQRTKKSKVDKALSKTEGAAMGLLAPPTNSDTASLIGWLGGDNPDGDPDETGIVGVRDGDSGVEVLLVERQGENIAVIPTDSHPESREIDLQELPGGALRERIMRSLVSIPSMRLRVKDRGLEEVIDEFVHELEKETRDLGVNWEKDFMLRGQVILPLQGGEYRTGSGKTISYRRDIGLQIFDTDSGM